MAFTMSENDCEVALGGRSGETTRTARARVLGMPFAEIYSGRVYDPADVPEFKAKIETGIAASRKRRGNWRN